MLWSILTFSISNFFKKPLTVVRISIFFMKRVSLVSFLHFSTLFYIIYYSCPPHKTWYLKSYLYKKCAIINHIHKIIMIFLLSYERFLTLFKVQNIVITINIIVIHYIKHMKNLKIFWNKNCASPHFIMQLSKQLLKAPHVLMKLQQKLGFW